MERYFSSQGRAFLGSAIDLKMDNVKTTHEKPIYLSVGEPNPSYVPKEMLAFLAKNIVLNQPHALQYEHALGNVKLRTFLVHHYRHQFPSLSLDNCIIASGSTQSLDMACKLFLDKGDICLVEDPTYSNIFATLNGYEADVVGVPVDEDGIRVDMVEAMLREFRTQGKTIKMLVTVPNAQNPSGVTLSLERRKRLFALAKTYDFLIVEDDPYAHLMYEESALPPISSFDETRENTVYLNSFSKMITPGLRVSWIFAHPKVIEKFAQIKQCIDSGSNSLTQELVASFCEKGELGAHLSLLQKTYKTNRDVMVTSLQKAFGEERGLSWNVPKGGMFVWVSFPEAIDVLTLLTHAADAGVVFLPGDAFSVSGRTSHCARLCFGYSDASEIMEGVKRLSFAYKKMKAINPS